MTLNLSLKQQSAFDLVLSDQASVLSSSTILKYNSALSHFHTFSNLVLISLLIQFRLSTCVVCMSQSHVVVSILVLF